MTPATSRKIVLTLPGARLEQLERLAERSGLSRNRLVELALERFLEEDPQESLRAAPPPPAEEGPTAGQAAGGRRPVRQGDVFWVALEEVNGVEPAYDHPHVVVQEDALNRSRIETVVVCALSSNLKRAKAPGNVLLEAGEANLPRQSVVVVSQVSAVDRAQLGEYIGTLSAARIHQILAGLRFVQALTEHPEAGR